MRMRPAILVIVLGSIDEVAAVISAESDDTLERIGLSGKQYLSWMTRRRSSYKMILVRLEVTDAVGV
jgi:hypothetical protein